MPFPEPEPPAGEERLAPRALARQREIVEAVRSRGAVPVADLAERFGVTHQTIRRDLRALEERGALQKGFGAAFAAPGVARHVHDERQATLTSVKRRLMEGLEEFLQPGSTVFVGLGTTFDDLHEVLAGRPRLLIATPNLTVAHRCALHTEATVYVYGGYVRRSDSCVLTLGEDPSRHRFKFDVAILGASAIDDEGSILEYDPLEVGLVHDVLRHSRRSVLVAHHEKFGNRAPHIVASLSDMDVVLTDRDPTDRLRSGVGIRDLRIASENEGDDTLRARPTKDV
ncbi:DeoR/GlpR family DNA-binding transcription regulator [Aureimonas sp. AU4]|uniref:DeoR/GlpR family DNA-binding transcription regulator n=1 Tax=Aureimonas sp. AU4 TaxID=1638163 RepID=UPI00078382FC|nr:DeoR/GlpR family DNA-binding transcription regulator [Aureimonas sp. AU4]